jgi:hypothetical protein
MRKTAMGFSMKSIKKQKSMEFFAKGDDCMGRTRDKDASTQAAGYSGCCLFRWRFSFGAAALLASSVCLCSTVVRRQVGTVRTAHGAAEQSTIRGAPQGKHDKRARGKKNARRAAEQGVCKGFTRYPRPRMDERFEQPAGDTRFHQDEPTHGLLARRSRTTDGRTDGRRLQ